MSVYEASRKAAEEQLAKAQLMDASRAGYAAGVEAAAKMLEAIASTWEGPYRERGFGSAAAIRALKEDTPDADA